MSGVVRQMLTCHWAGRRVQRYLDADPAAPLTPGEITRLEEHLDTCERCGEVLRQHRMLHRALSLWSGHQPVDAEAAARLRNVLDGLTEGRSA